MALNFCADVPLRTYSLSLSLSLSRFTGSTFSESSLSFLALTLNLRLARTLAAIVSQTVLWQSLSLIRCCISRLSCTLHGRLAWPHSASRTTIDITKAAGCIVVVLCKAILNSSITANVSTGASFVWLSTGLCVSVLYPIIMINVSIITVVFSVQFCKQLSKQQQKLLLLVCLKHCITSEGRLAWVRQLEMDKMWLVRTLLGDSHGDHMLEKTFREKIVVETDNYWWANHRSVVSAKAKIYSQADLNYPKSQI